MKPTFLSLQLADYLKDHLRRAVTDDDVQRELRASVLSTRVSAFLTADALHVLRWNGFDV